MKQCKDCFYWMMDKPETNGSKGTCTRYPPVIVGMDTMQPTTLRWTTCGEFKDEEKEGER